MELNVDDVLGTMRIQVASLQDGYAAHELYHQQQAFDIDSKWKEQDAAMATANAKLEELHARLLAAEAANGRGRGGGKSMLQSKHMLPELGAVSNTHLTLPTIY